MVQTRNVTKRQKTEECTSCMELVMFNSDSLFKIASYLPADGLLNLALTCRRFGIATLPDRDGDSSLSLVEETTRRVVQDIATEEEKNALPGYEDNWLCKYNHLQLFRIPLTFDQLVGLIDYVKRNKSCVVNRHRSWATAFSNNIMMAGKYYALFKAYHGICFSIGVMRPGKAMQSAQGGPMSPLFYQHFTERRGSEQYNNSVNCCMYDTFGGYCYSHDWRGGRCMPPREAWDGMEGLSGSFQVGMLLDLDEGTLSVYSNGRKLGVIKRGLAGQYCWVVTMSAGSQVAIKRGTVPAS